MMPLSMLSVGSTDTIKKITGKDEGTAFSLQFGTCGRRVRNRRFGNPWKSDPRS